MLTGNDPLEPKPSPQKSGSLLAWASLEQTIGGHLAALRERDQYRTLQQGFDSSLIDLSTNDYLGLRDDLPLRRKCLEAIHDLPVGSGASRLLGGEHPVFQQLETTFARFKGTEAALYFNSGYAANEAVFKALLHQEAELFSDALNHASMIDGVRLSRWPKERIHIFGHGDFADLEQKLKRSKAAYNLIAVESLYSMDGDLYDLKNLATLAQQYRGILLIDEAHALGVYGVNGNGLLSECNLSHEHVITVNPCGKAMAAMGAFVAGPRWLREYLINTARPFIFSTGPSPWLAQALMTIIETVKERDEARQKLKREAQLLREYLQELGFDTGFSGSCIIPVILGDNAKALRASELLKQRGIIAKAVRPPTVPPETARLRLSLRASFGAEEWAWIRKGFRSLKDQL